MKVLLTGGGSGGHITPVLAVAHELKRKYPKIDLVYAIGKGDKLQYLPEKDTSIDRVVTIRSGKFRRYHGAGLLQIFDIPTLFKNIRDFFFVGIGFVQSWFFLRHERPDVIFIKGGFVGVPIGLAAATLKIPYITHDSDAIPGLANRIISKWATLHTVAMPVENYSYDMVKTRQVGVPFSKDYVKVDRKQQKKYMQALNIPDDSEVLLITGGGLGARRLSTAVTKISRVLLARRPDLYILHITGPGHQADVQAQYNAAMRAVEPRIIVEEFVRDMYRFSGAADVIVARAGANSLAEFAAQQKACIIVPNPQLTGGHQSKNAQVLSDAGAIVQVDDVLLQKNPELLLKEVETLLDSVHERAKLAIELHKMADYTAASKLAEYIVESTKSNTKGEGK